MGTHGNLQAIVGGESFGIIFFEKAIYRMEYVGTPLIFTFNKIADNVGAFAPRSVCSFGSDIFFLAQDGFYKLSGGQKLTPIGNGRVDNFFFEDLSSNLDGICSAIDPNNSIAVWSYRGSGATGTTNNKLLIYNYSVDKWSTGSGQDLEFIASASQEAFNTLESLDVLGDLDNLTRSLTLTIMEKVLLVLLDLTLLIYLVSLLLQVYQLQLIRQSLKEQKVEGQH